LFDSTAALFTSTPVPTRYCVFARSVLNKRSSEKRSSFRKDLMISMLLVQLLCSGSSCFCFQTDKKKKKDNKFKKDF
jgi:hypothetical protein